MNERTNHWQRFPPRWSRVQPPLRPDHDVVSRLRTLAGTPTGPVLLLGVTPELAEAFTVVCAVDKSAAMIADIWPGDTEQRTAVQGDWLGLDASSGRFAAVVGDGSISVVSSLAEFERLLAIVAERLEPGGRFACRYYERPATPIDEPALRSTIAHGSLNFHAFKWQLAMHVAAKEGATVRAQRIADCFNALCPDREALAVRTGWSRDDIDMIDVYEGSTVAYVFADRAEVVHRLPANVEGVEFVACGSYDLASCCPILTFRKPC